MAIAKDDKGLREIREAIVQCHRNGGCDSDGNTDFVNDALGYRRAIARPTIRNSRSTAVKTYIVRNGKLVLKE